MELLFDPIAFGLRVEIALVSRDLTVHQAAEEIGVWHSALYRVISGKSPSVETFLRICRWLDQDSEMKSLCTREPSNAGLHHSL